MHRDRGTLGSVSALQAVLSICGAAGWYSSCWRELPFFEYLAGVVVGTSSGWMVTVIWDRCAGPRMTQVVKNRGLRWQRVTVNLCC